MGATDDDDEADRAGPRRHFTTIELTERDGEWVATQGTIPVAGRGETAAAAAADYCRKVEGRDA